LDVIRAVVQPLDNFEHRTLRNGDLDVEHLPALLILPETVNKTDSSSM
jgi:hypothetical protein